MRGSGMKVEQTCKILSKRQLNAYAVEMDLAVGDMVRASLTDRKSVV